MKPLRDQKNIEEMRKRLYDRGAEVEKAVRHDLTDKKVDVSRDWNVGEKTATDKDTATDTPPEPTTTAAGGEDNTGTTKPKRHYRAVLLIGSLFIFICLAGLSAVFLYFGSNEISNENIEILVDGPRDVGGGERLSLGVTVGNYNSVPIESATLILKYPPGTRSTGDSPRNLYEERIPIEGGLDPGEARNIPAEVALYGEENSTKNIQATIEYRVENSNGTFYKDSEPLSVNINSSPLVLRVENIEKVASGQLVNVTLTAQSNSSSVLRDLLITASYPSGFDYETSSPEPEYGENVWRIDELEPEESSTIEIEGVISGLTEESLRLNFNAGPAESDNQYTVGAILAENTADFTIERPFIDIEIGIDDDYSGDVTLPAGEESRVTVDVTNTLDETIYDMAIEVVPGGNALTEDSIESGSGFFDSNTGNVRWEVSNNSSFDQILPGDSRSLDFDVTPVADSSTASFALEVNVYARRVGESSATESLVGTKRAEAKYSSIVNVGRQAGLASGPVPPEVGEETTYDVSLVAEAGANDITNGIIETSLPVHVEWLDNYDGDGTLTYNSVSKTLEWEFGDISANDRKEFNFTVSMQPSSSQAGTTPVLVNSQNMRANDRFTGDLLQASAPALTTELSTELGYEEGNGRVER